MAAEQQNAPGFLSPQTAGKESRSFVPWIIAGAVVVVVVAGLIFFSHKPARSNPGGAGLAAADPYAASLPVSEIKMSESTSLSGGKVTYVDGHIANHGSETVTAITAQVAFLDFGNQLVQKETMPLTLIRTRQPYVDTEMVSADPIKPGEERDFRLVLDHVAQDWNGQYPEIRLIEITGK